MLKLKCKECGDNYEKPEDFKKLNLEFPNIFFKLSLKYCDKCRRQKEIQALKRLPDILKILGDK